LPILYGALTLLLLYNITDRTSVTIRQRFQKKRCRSGGAEAGQKPIIRSFTM
jgi:hypothetical protein